MKFRSTGPTVPETPAGGMRRPLSRISERWAPRPRRDRVLMPSPPSTTKPVKVLLIWPETVGHRRRLQHLGGADHAGKTGLFGRDDLDRRVGIELVLADARTGDDDGRAVVRRLGGRRRRRIGGGGRGGRVLGRRRLRGSCPAQKQGRRRRSRSGPCRPAEAYASGGESLTSRTPKGDGYIKKRQWLRNKIEAIEKRSQMRPAVTRRPLCRKKTTKMPVFEQLGRYVTKN